MRLAQRDLRWFVRALRRDLPVGGDLRELGAQVPHMLPSSKASVEGLSPHGIRRTAGDHDQNCVLPCIWERGF